MLARAAFVAAAALAATILVPAISQAETVQVRYVSTVKAVSTRTNTLIFNDKSQAIVDKSIPVTAELVGKTVEIGAMGDEDGNQPAKMVRVIN